MKTTTFITGNQTKIRHAGEAKKGADLRPARQTAKFQSTNVTNYSYVEIQSNYNWI
jgi:hypothetical protein